MALKHQSRRWQRQLLYFAFAIKSSTHFFCVAIPLNLISSPSQISTPLPIESQRLKFKRKNNIPISCQIRGGGDDDFDSSDNIQTKDVENAELDAFVNELIDGVTSSDEQDLESKKKSEKKLKNENYKDQRKIKDKSILFSVLSETIEKKEEDDIGIEEKEADIKTTTSNPELETIEHGNSTLFSTNINPRQKERKKGKAGTKGKVKGKKTLDKKTSQSINSKSKIDSIPELEPKPKTIAMKSISKQTHPVTPPPRPNMIFRFLLKKGFLGHTIIMIFITIYEFIKKFLPTLIYIIQWVLIKLRLYDPKAYTRSSSSSSASSLSSSKINHMNVNVNAQYGAFVDLSKSTRKNRVAQRKQMDIVSYQKLKLLGKTARSMEEVKYRHCSTSFMKRHQLGEFRNNENRSSSTSIAYQSSTPDQEINASPLINAKAFSSTESTLEGSVSQTKQRKKRDDDDDDIEWVIEALHIQRNSDLLASVLNDTPQKTSKKNVNPKENSSSSKGGGFMKSLQNTISGSGTTRILGAYPNDAVSIEEAGSADGVVSLARRYGYGEWNWDDNDNFDSDDDTNSFENNIKEEPIHKQHILDDLNDLKFKASNEKSKDGKKEPFFQIGVSFSGDSNTRIKRSKRINVSSSSLSTERSKRKSSGQQGSFNPLDIASEKEHISRRISSSWVSEKNSTKNIIKKKLMPSVKDSLKSLTTKSLASKKFHQKQIEKNASKISVASSIGRELTPPMKSTYEASKTNGKHSSNITCKPMVPMRRTKEIFSKHGKLDKDDE